MFEPDGWLAAFILNKMKAPTTPPTISEVILLIARVGSFLARKGDGDPSVKILWQGLQ